MENPGAFCNTVSISSTVEDSACSSRVAILLGKNIMSAEMKLSTDSKRTILVVDDFDDTRLLLRTWLERKGYRVVEAENGKQAIAEAESKQPDLIIMDVEMPELDGLSATRKIRTLPGAEHVPIVVVSAYGADQFRDAALAAGCNAYVSTPFEPDVLEKLIADLIH
jgi:CheY-like chemotaxis protein